MRWRTTVKDLQKAVKIYLDCAYFGDSLPEPVVKRLESLDCRTVSSFLSSSPFETKLSNPATGHPSVFRLRLGNRRYPHMKLGIEWFVNEERAVLCVDTHDQHFGEPSDKEQAEKLQELRAFNASVKTTIESNWRKTGFPTFGDDILADVPKGACLLNGKGRVLLVEDEESIRQAEIQLLEAGGYQVTACSDGDQALKSLDSGHRPDLCLLDIMLPGMSGYEILHVIRKRLGLEVPVIFVSGLPEKLAQERGDGYLEKPFSGTQLLETVSQALKPR